MTPDTLELLREVGHRLRTPLATVHGYASLLEAHVQDPRVEPADLALWAHRIQLETDRLNGLLVDLSRLRAAVAGTTRPTSLELRRLVQESVRQAELELDQRLPFEDGEPLIYAGDAALLKRVAYHLAILGLQRRGAGLYLASEPSGGARLELRLPSGWTPPQHDVWLFFCQSVAEAHAGRLEHSATGPTLYLGQPA
jgi:phospho-acceptor domain-containing protein